jgi:hypothetical protein
VTRVLVLCHRRSLSRESGGSAEVIAVCGGGWGVGGEVGGECSGRCRCCLVRASGRSSLPGRGGRVSLEFGVKKANLLAQT